jgi:hypothetical protein
MPAMVALKGFSAGRQPEPSRSHVCRGPEQSGAAQPVTTTAPPSDDTARP